MHIKRTKYLVFLEIMRNEWDNITLEQFAQIRAVFADKGKSEEDKMVSLAAIVQGCDEDTILDMPLDKVRPIFARVQGLDNKPQRSKIRKHYQVGKWALLLTEADKMTVSQWIDFQNYYREDIDNHLEDILSVALVPIGKRYNEGYDIKELKEAIKGMPVCDALAVCFFFQKKWLKSMRFILTYLVGWTTMKGEKELRRKALETRREISAMLHSL